MADWTTDMASAVESTAEGLLILIFQGDKSSRAQILKKASEYIAFMRRKNGSHATDIEDLRRQNAHLENQVLNVLEDFPVEDFNW